MSLHAVWVHGNAARAQWVGDPPIIQAQDRLADGSTGGVPWTDIVGLPQGKQMVFRGKGHTTLGLIRRPQPSTFFHFVIPTPVIVRGVRAQLTTVFVLWRADPGIRLQEVNVFDGIRQIPVNFSTPVGGGRDGSGGVPADLVSGMTSFAVPSRPAIFFGVGISVGFAFPFAAGNLAFTSAGADFEVPGV